MQSSATTTPADDHASDTLAERKRRNAVDKLQICREAVLGVDTAEKESWSRIMRELAEGGFEDADLETELAASRNTLYKWKTGAAAPREMTRRLLQKAIVELIDQRLQHLRG